MARGTDDRRLRHAELSPSVAQFLLGLGAALLLAVPLLQPSGELWEALGALRDGLAAAQQVDGALAKHRRVRQAMEQFEHRLEESSWVVTELRPPLRAGAVRFLGQGSPEVQIGRDGWWFYRPAVTSLSGPGFLDPEVLRAARRDQPERAADPRPALLQLAADLATRGIGLAVLPVPEKAAILPERLMRGAGTEPLRNPSLGKLTSELEAAGIEVIELQSALRAAAASGETPYLERDTHWSPAGLERAVAEVASWARRHGLAEGRGELRRRRVRLAGDGDLVRQLGLDRRWRITIPQQVEGERVESGAGEAWEPSSGAALLLLGDSYSNVFSRPDLGWGTSAGLAEQLAWTLGAPVDRIAINAGGAVSSRRELRRQLLDDPQRLSGTRWVILEFAARELAHGDWQPTPLAAPARR